MESQVSLKAINYSSHHHQNPHEWLPDLQEEGWKWSSQTSMPGERVVFCFDSFYDVSKIIIPKASSDVTADQFRLAVFLQGEEGSWAPVSKIEDTNIQRPTSALSAIPPRKGFDTKADTLERPWEINLERPIKAKAMAVTFEGHGWFSLDEKPQIYGEVCVKAEKPKFVVQSGTTVIL